MADQEGERRFGFKVVIALTLGAFLAAGLMMDMDNDKKAVKYTEITGIPVKYDQMRNYSWEMLDKLEKAKNDRRTGTQSANPVSVGHADVR